MAKATNVPAPEVTDLEVPQTALAVNITRLAGEFSIGASADGTPIHAAPYVSAANAAGKIESLNKSLSDSARAVRGAQDPLLARRFRSSAAKSLELAQKTAADAIDTIGQHRAAVESEIENAIGIPTARNSVTDSQRASDIRATLRSLPGSPARTQAIENAIRAGDLEAAAAVLSASPLASAIDPADHKLIRSAAELRAAPRMTNLRASIDKVSAALRRQAEATVDRWGPMVGVGDSAHADATRALTALEGGAN